MSAFKKPSSVISTTTKKPSTQGNQDDHNLRGNLMSRYKFHMVKFNKVWSEVQQKQEIIKLTYDGLKKLESMMIAQDLHVPKPVPAFQVLEYGKPKNSPVTTSSSATNTSEAINICIHEDLLNSLKMVKEENIELIRSLENLRKQQEEKEKKMKMAEVQTDIVFKELEAKQVCFMCTSANVVESDTSEMSSRTDNECQTYDAELSQAESEILKMLYEQAEQRCTILKDKLDIALAKLESLEAEQRRNSAKSPSLLCQESQTQVELYEISELYEGFVEMKTQEDISSLSTDSLKENLEKSKVQICNLEKHISLLQFKLEETNKENDLLHKCLIGNRKIGLEIDTSLYKRYDHETKECQTSFEAEFVKKLNIYLDSLEIDDGRKNCLRPCVNESASYDKLFHHIKTVYDVIENTDKCNRDNEKRVKLLEKTNAELIKGKEKLEKRTQKLSEICKAFQGLNEVQEKELRHYNDTKTTLAEKTRQCEFLTKRIADLEVVIRKIKDRKNDFKKKYFKEKQANKKMKKEKNHINWLSKIFDWKQLAPT